ncbi:MAG: hypothetical protein WC732_08715 [Candidatus Omnitrophota bacterium]
MVDTREMRTLHTAVTGNLLGSLCVVEGTLEGIRNSNPFTRSTRAHHQWMVLLVDVRVGNVIVDHLWLDGCKRLNAVAVCPRGTRVRLTGVVKTYVHAGVVKWTLKSPYRNVATSLT